jgi:hypothetical protein
MKKNVHIVGNFSMATTDAHHVTGHQKTTEKTSRANDRTKKRKRISSQDLTDLIENSEQASTNLARQTVVRVR